MWIGTQHLVSLLLAAFGSAVQWLLSDPRTLLGSYETSVQNFQKKRYSNFTLQDYLNGQLLGQEENERVTNLIRTPLPTSFYALVGREGRGGVKPLFKHTKN